VVGHVKTFVNEERTLAVITVDLEGGRYSETPGSAPDGSVDWSFVLTQLVTPPAAFSGLATLRMPEGSGVFLDFIEVTEMGQSPVMFRAERATVPADPSSAGIRTCKILHLNSIVNETHDKAGPYILGALRWNEGTSFGGVPPCDRESAL
jgi:hypothetical protein